MSGQMTFRGYRAMDIGVFTLLLCISETLIAFASRVWFPFEAYTLSVVPAVTAVVMMRWGIFSVIPAVVGGAVLPLVSGADAFQYLIYIIGNLFFLILYPAYKKIGWKRIHENVLLTMLYGALAALTMQLGRTVLSLIVGNSVSVSLGFIFTDALSGLFSVLILWILRRLDGMLEDQKHYLFRVQREEKNKRGSDR